MVLVTRPDETKDQGELPFKISVPVCVPPFISTEQVGPLPLVAPFVVETIEFETVIVPD